jgi:hypothetical protein
MSIEILLAISPTTFQLLGEVDLADVVAREGSDGSFAELVGEAVLEDSYGLAGLETCLDCEVAVEVSFEQLFAIVLDLDALDPIKGGLLTSPEKD